MSDTSLALHIYSSKSQSEHGQNILTLIIIFFYSSFQIDSFFQLASQIDQHKISLYFNQSYIFDFFAIKFCIIEKIKKQFIIKNDKQAIFVFYISFLNNKNDIICNKIMRAKRSQTQQQIQLIHHKQLNSRIKRSNQSIKHHEVLRLQVLQRLDLIKKIFNKNQKQLCDFFIKYSPLQYSDINVKKIVDQRYEEVRLIKNANKIYFGMFKNETREGEGILIDDKGKIYEGYFEQNYKNGHGVEIYPNGNIYIGRFEKNKKHGKGQFYWFSLSPPAKQDALYVQYYDGSWWGGLPDGIGSHQKSNGDIYDGQFKNGLKHGKGEQYFFNGDSYKGQYVNGLPEGNGIYIWNDGSKYQGDFKQGLRSGHGIWISSDGKDQYKGQYLLDKKCGFGQYSWSDRKFLYKGHFENDLRHGYGQLYRDGVEQYRGQWLYGKVKQNVHDVSIKQNSIIHTSKSSKFPSLTKLKPPASAILHRIINTQFVPKKPQFKKLQRSKSPKSNSVTSMNKFKNGLSGSKKKISLQKTLKKRPVSVYPKHVCASPLAKYDAKYELLVKKCNKRNCGCNVSIPLDNKIGIKERRRLVSYCKTQGR